MNEVFNLFDKDGGGTISKEELEEVMRIGYRKPTEDEV